MTLIEVGSKPLAAGRVVIARDAVSVAEPSGEASGVAALERQLEPARQARQRILEPRRRADLGQHALAQPRMNVGLAQRVALASPKELASQRHDVESCRPTPMSTCVARSGRRRGSLARPRACSRSGN